MPPVAVSVAVLRPKSFRSGAHSPDPTVDRIDRSDRVSDGYEPDVPSL
jgi:hypothetical protein